MKKVFATLYKKASTGAIVQWTIEVEDQVIRTSWGQMGGTIQVAEDFIKEGKNTGRANATTPKEQALAEAEAKWSKQLKKSYVKTLSAAQAGESSDMIEGGILPMLAHKYRDHGDKIMFPAYAQPKLDGHRCIAVVDANGKCMLWSRTRKPIVSMPHIIDAIERLNKTNYVFDGELYSDDYKDRFEELCSFIRPEYVKPGHEVVHYHIYDLANTQLAFKQRTQHLQNTLVRAELPLVLVETIGVANEDALMLAFEDFLKQGYEGAIVRNADGLYVNKRSYDLQKIKTFDDSEFKVIGVVEGRGKLAGHAIFQCETQKGAKFEAKMKGEIAKLVEYWQHPERAIGRMLTVQYQGMTTKTNVPRFPVALRFSEAV